MDLAWFDNQQDGYSSDEDTSCPYYQSKRRADVMQLLEDTPVVERRRLKITFPRTSGHAWHDVLIWEFKQPQFHRPLWTPPYDKSKHGIFNVYLVPTFTWVKEGDIRPSVMLTWPLVFLEIKADEYDDVDDLMKKALGHLQWYVEEDHTQIQRTPDLFGAAAVGKWVIFFHWDHEAKKFFLLDGQDDSGLDGIEEAQIVADVFQSIRETAVGHTDPEVARQLIV